jgi:hypothetical protein
MENQVDQNCPQDLSQILTGNTPEDKKSEEELQAGMIKYFSRRFFVFPEVWDSTGKFRIDLVIIHRSDAGSNCPIGIEIKLATKKRGKDLAMWLKQTSNYADQKFGKFGKCLIVTCPQISDYYLREGERMHQHEGEMMYANNVGTFIGQFNIGEVQKIDSKNCRIVFKGQIIWDSISNEFRSNNYEKLCPR